MLKRNGKVVVPNQNNLRQRVIRECHDSPCAGHPGVEKTYDLVKRDFFWPRMKNHIHEYVAQCFACQVSKAERVKPPGFLQPVEIPSGKWESISMDFIVDLPTTQGGYDAILVVVDRLTKMAHFIPTRESVSAPQVADLFISHIFRLHGLPRFIVSDRDTRFTSHFWTAVFDAQKTELGMSSGDHPETDGQTERVNQTLEDMLRSYVSLRQHTWNKWLPLLEFAYNDRKHSSTGMSPFELNYGYRPANPTTVGVSQKVPSAADYVVQMRKMLALAKDNIR